MILDGFGGTWEIKSERASGRCFIEFANKHGEPSGISLSTSEKWVEHIGGTVDDNGVASGGFLAIFDTEKVRQYVVQQVEAHSDKIRSFPNYGLLIEYSEFTHLC